MANSRLVGVRCWEGIGRCSLGLLGIKISKFSYLITVIYIYITDMKDL